MDQLTLRLALSEYNGTETIVISCAAWMIVFYFLRPVGIFTKDSISTEYITFGT